jgi:hypothetical protein
MFGTVLGALWSVVTLPFRLLARLVELFGRLAALAIGFVLMVVGFALWAGALAVVGIPTFIVGLLLTLRSLE